MEDRENRGDVVQSTRFGVVIDFGRGVVEDLRYQSYV